MDKWILEDIRYIRSKRWKTEEEEAYLEELHELRDALQKLDKKKGGLTGDKRLLLWLS